MSAEEGWGDLFAKAADIESHAETSSKNLPPRSSPSSTTTGKSKKRKRHEHKRKPDSVDHEFVGMLNGRSDPTTTKSAWTDNKLLGKRLDAPKKIRDESPRQCPGWRASPGSDEICCCGYTPIYHEMSTLLSEDLKAVGLDSGWPSFAYCTLRNIRCCAKNIAKSALLPVSHRSKLYDLLPANQHLPNTICHFPPLPGEEADILLDKLESLKNVFEKLEASIKADITNNEQSSSHTRPKDRERQSMITFESAIRVIMACDACYYRYYYQQITGLHPTLRLKSNGRRLFLPHPHEHFETQLGSMSNVVDSSKTFMENLGHCPSLPNYVLQTKEVEVDGDHAMARLYKYRWWETIELFYNTGFSRSKRVEKLVDKSLTAEMKDHSSDTLLLKHETPAPEILSEWRDSCRDFVCNIYAYATLSPEINSKILEFLFRHKVRKIVEVGAGTGYVAKVLGDAAAAMVDSDEKHQGIEIEAWDIAPMPLVSDPDVHYGKPGQSEAMNEYHGYTPAFCAVKKSTAKVSTIVNNGDAHKSALLLCYPPPQSSMANDTLSAFLKSGGSFVIHIGEFKGLTGDQDFEKLLQRKMKCIKRLPTLTWGTDASHVTIWTLKASKEEKEKSMILPCSTCKSKEAVKRLRLDRTIVYCSDRCCKQGTADMQQRLRLRMIEVDCVVGDNFHDPKYFSNL